MRGFILTTGLLIAASVIYLNAAASDRESEVRTWNGFEFAAKGKIAAGRGSELEVKDLSTGRIVFQVKSPDLNLSHYHCCEFTHGNLYVIKRTGDDSAASGQWTDELWRFPAAGTAQKLYEAQGLDFRVSPKGDLIAVILDHEIAFLESSGKVVHETVFDPKSTNLECDKLKSTFIGLGDRNAKWSKDGSEFWGEIQCLYVTPLFYKIEVPSWRLTTFRRADSVKGAEKGWTSSDIALDPDSGKVAFSDYPFVFDADTAIEIEKSRKKFHLFVQDLKTGRVRRIATSIGKEFDPVWVDPHILEYKDPTGEKRVRLNLDP